MNELITINESNREFPVSARELYEKLGYNSAHWAEWYQTNIINNQFAIEGTDYEVFTPTVNTSGGRPTKDFYLSIDFAKRLCMMARTEVGEQFRNYFIEVEKRFHAQSIIPQTMPETLLLAAQIINEHEKRLSRAEERTATVERTLTLVKDTLIERDDDWRKWVNHQLNRVADSAYNGQMDRHKKARSLSYELLEDRAHCRIDVRLENLRGRMSDRGWSKTKLNALNALDILEEEPRLKEIYTSIIKELIIKYVA